MLRLLSSSTMVIPAIFLPSIRSRITGRLTLPWPSEAVADVMLTPGEILDMKVLNQRQEVLHDLNRVHAALLQLADVRTELHVPRVDRFHHRVGLFPGFHRSARVLMHNTNDADIRQGLGYLVQGCHDIRLHGVEIEVPAPAIRSDDCNRSPILLDETAPAHHLLDLVLPPRRVRQVAAAIGGDRGAVCTCPGEDPGHRAPPCLRSAN